MANNTTDSSLTTNFNVDPYYDDYDESKGYYKILYRPGYSVQGRELNQMQTMLQKQVDRVGKHVFQEGSIVLVPRIFEIQNDNNFQYVKIKDSDTNSEAVDVDDLKGLTITGATSGIKAYVVDVGDGSETANSTKTLFVSYTSFNTANTTQKTFLPNETLTSNNGTAIVLASNPTGSSSRFLISEGTIFAKEHFLKFDTQSVILDRYSPSPTCRVGFKLLEDIVRYTQDSSLLDPALESSNYTAPGADRFRIRAVLTTLPIDDDEGAPDFVEIITVKEGAITESYQRPQYNVLRDELAKRTFDESGDYYVDGLSVRVKEHLDTNTNYGLLQSGNSQYLSVGVEPGTGYCKGYEFKKWQTEYVTTPKSVEKETLQNQILSSSLGNYVTIDEVSGAPTLDNGTTVLLYDTAQNRVSAPNAVTGNVIGVAKIMSTVYDTGTLGTPTGTLRFHLFDIKMNGSNSFTNTKSFYSSTTPSPFYADVVLDSSNNATLQESTINSLLYYVGKPSTNSTSDLSFSFRKTESSVTISNSGVLSATIADANEVFPYGPNATLSATDKRDIILTLNAARNVSTGLTASGTNGTSSITGTGFNILNVGDKIQFPVNGPTGAYFIQSINAGGTAITLDRNITRPAVANTLTKYYAVGDMVDLVTRGINATRTASIDPTNKTITIDLAETFGVTTDSTLTFPVTRSTAQPASKTLRDNRFVRINCSTAGTTGPFNLGIADVYNIRYIRKHTASFTNETEGTDVTGQFRFDNGQRDTHYDHATVTPTSRFLASTDYLLIKLDYFHPSFTSGKGYFNINSYPINDNITSNTSIRTETISIYVSPYSGLSYSLRNYLDYRPVKTLTATDSTTVGGSTTNPAVTNTFQSDGVSLRIPAPNRQITYDYTYYLARIDLVVINKEGVIQVIKGMPSVFPRTPSAPENTMALASVAVMPYPSLSPEYAQKINRSDLGCSVKKMSNIRSTMRDINVMKNRISNLELYTSLSLLEKSALDLKVLDENGLDRFKNGVFVDSFSDHLLGDKNNLDYRIVVDKNERCIRPAFTTHSFKYHLTANTGTVVNGDIVTLPFTEKVLIDRPKASSFTNIELQVYRYIGQMYLDPPGDNWVDTVTVPPNALTMGLQTTNSLDLVLPELNLQNDLGNLNLDLGVISQNIDLGTISVDNNIDLTHGSSPQAITTYWGAPKTVVVGVNYYQRTGSGWNTKGPLLVSGKADTAALYQQALAASRDDRLYKDIIYATITEGTRIGSEYFTSSDTSVVGISASSYDSSSVSATTSGTSYASSSASASSTDTSTSTVNLGERVVDTSIQPYIRGNKTIKIHAKGLMGNTKMYVFFDGENMTQYVTPLTYDQYNSYPWAENDVTPYTSSTANVAQRTVRTDNFDWRVSSLPQRGAPLFTTAQGDIFAALWLPETKKFTTGTKEVVITDSPTNSTTDSSCFATAFFVAQGLLQYKQDTILTTRFTSTIDLSASASATSTATVSATAQVGVATSVTGNVSTTTTVTDLNTTTTGVSQSTTSTTTQRLGPSCSAYSFLPEAPIGDEGVFLSSVDVYFASKDPVLGCWFEICEMTNDGGVTRNQVPFSEVWMEPNEVVISDDATAPTKVRFPSPVFLYSGVQYAFIMHTVGLNPNYRIWVSKLGETDLITGSKVNSRPLTGTFFRTNNGKNWDIIPDIDLKCTFYRCSFTTNTDGTCVLGNEPAEKLLVTQPTAVFNTYGEGIVGDDKLTLSNISGGTITVGMYLRGANSTANSVVLDKSGSLYSMSNTRYRIGETVTSNTGITATISDIDSPEGILSSHSTTARAAIIEINSSNGEFKDNVTIRGLQSGNRARVYANLNYRYSVADFEPAFLKFNRTGVLFDMKPTSNTGIAGSWHRVEDNIDHEYNTEQAILSRTNEIATYGTSTKSNEVRMTMSTLSEYVSPVLDIGRTHTLYTDNLINANTYGENGISGGTLFNKYISKIVTLAEGQDAEDLRIILTAYRPSTTDINVWVKILHSEDGDIFSRKPWVLMSKTGSNLYSSETDKKDYKEFIFTFPETHKDVLSLTSVTVGSNGVIDYTNKITTKRSGEANVTSTVTLVEGSFYFMDTTGFIAGESVNVLWANSTYKGTATVSIIGQTPALTGTNGEVRYSTGTGAPYEGYKYFAVKIGLSGTNSAIVPKVADLRCLGLQM